MDKKVLYPDKYIIQAIRLIRVRWLVSVFALISVFVAWFFKVPGPYFPGLFVTVSILLVLNFIYFLCAKRVGRKCEGQCERPAKFNIVVQIVSDFLILTTILHFSGGVENPVIVFYIFHMIISGIFLKPRNAYLITLLAVSLFLSLVISEYTGLLPHYSINKYILQLIINEPVYIFISLALFVITSFVAAFIAVILSEQLRLTQKLLEISNQSLLEKDKIKDEFVQGVTHDIKGGLAVVLSNISVVDKQILGPVSPANADFVKRAMNRTRGMLSFVNELLTLTRMRLANRLDLSAVDVSEVINSVISSNAQDAEKKNIKVTFRPYADHLTISAIRVSIEETMANLIQNAIKYSPEGGNVDVSAKAISGKVVIEISDTGYGIPEDDIPYIFDDFYRAKNVKKIEGTGLGLALVKAIVTRHNGTIKSKK